MKTYLYRASNLHHFSDLSLITEVNFWRPLKTVNSCDLFIREYGSTLYVGLARAVSPTNTNFRLTFLLTRLQETLYEDLAEVNFWRPFLEKCLAIPTSPFFHLLVNGFSVIIIIIIIIIFLRRVFSECTEAVATSLIHYLPIFLRFKPL